MTETDNLYRIWVYLAQAPLFWLSATLVAFVIGDGISARLKRHPWPIRW